MLRVLSGLMVLHLGRSHWCHSCSLSGWGQSCGVVCNIIRQASWLWNASRQRPCHTKTQGTGDIGRIPKLSHAASSSDQWGHKMNVYWICKIVILKLNPKIWQVYNFRAYTGPPLWQKQPPWRSKVPLQRASIRSSWLMWLGQEVE